MKDGTAKARIQLLSIEEGGRTEPLRSGYRSLLRFDGTLLDFGFQFDLDPNLNATWPWLAVGESGRGQVSFWALDELPELRSGMKFEVREGKRVVGLGEILS